MEQQEVKPRLIHTRLGATIALCCTGYVAALSFPDVVSHPQRKHEWLIESDLFVFLHIPLPAWAVVGLNLVFYAGLLYGFLSSDRIAQGKERVLVVGWAAVIFLGLVQIFASSSVITAIQYVKAAITVIMFLVAVDILLRIPVSGYARIEKT